MSDRFDDWKCPEIVHNQPTVWQWMVSYPNGLKMGRLVDIGAFCYIQAEYCVILGDNCQVGAHCAIYSVNTIDGQVGAVNIGKNACVGAGSVILPKVTIGEGAKVGAMSFVKYGTQIPPHETWVGIPAKKLK